MTSVVERERPLKIFAQDLLRLRSDQKLSLEQLANISGVSRAMLRQIEKGKSVSTLDVADRIASGLICLCQMLKPWYYTSGVVVRVFGSAEGNNLPS